MTSFTIGDVVRVAKLLTAHREVDGSSAEPPQPRTGETAAIVDVLGDDLYLVERTTDDGRTIWLAEFAAEELTLVEGAGESR